MQKIKNIIVDMSELLYPLMPIFITIAASLGWCWTLYLVSLVYAPAAAVLFVSTFIVVVYYKEFKSKYQ